MATDRVTILEGQTVTLTEESFSSLSGSVSGGAIWNAGEAIIIDSNFDNVSAVMGGAIYSESIAGLSSSSISNSIALQTGGGVYNPGVMTIDDCVFSGNTASINSGAFFNTGEAVLNDISFNDNRASAGGAVYNTGNATISDVALSGNTATQNGGALYNFGTASISNGTFTNNNSTRGGAIYNQGTLTLTDIVFSDNTSKTAGAIYQTGSGVINLDNCVFSTVNDSVYIKKGTVNVTGNLETYSEFLVDATAELSFSNQSEIAVIGALSFADTATLCFANTGVVNFSDAQDFSNVSIALDVDWDASKTQTVASGDFTFATGQKITVNDETFTLGSSKKTYEGNYIKAQTFEYDYQTRFVVSSFENKVDISDKENGLVNLATIVKNSLNTSIGFDSITNGNDITKVTLGTNNLVAGASKAIMGNGSVNTTVKSNLFGNGNTLSLSNLTWDGFVFGGGNGTHAENIKGAVTLTGAVSVTNVFGGSRIGSALISGGTSSLLLTEDVGGDFTLLVGANLVSAESTEISDSSLTILSDDVDVSGGFVIGGSIVNKAVDYTVDGKVAMRIDGGFYDWVVGSGFLQVDNAFYTQDGDVELNISGGTINTVFGGVSASYAKYGTKSINGNINITLDSSENAIAVHTLFAGCNGENSTVDGSVTVTFTGLGSNLTFTGNNNGVVGDSATPKRTVTGERTLAFTQFSGEFDADSAKKFDTVKFSGSDVTMHVYDLSDVSSWNFDIDSSVTWTDGRNNDFSGDTLKITGTAVSSATSFFTANDEALVSGWDDFEAVSLFGENAVFDDQADKWVSDHYTMTCESTGDEYRLSVSTKIA